MRYFVPTRSLRGSSARNREKNSMPFKAPPRHPPRLSNRSSPPETEISQLSVKPSPIDPSRAQNREKDRNAAQAPPPPPAPALESLLAARNRDLPVVGQAESDRTFSGPVR